MESGSAIPRQFDLVRTTGRVTSSTRTGAPDWVVGLFVVGWTVLIATISVWRVWGLAENGPDLGFFVHALAAVARDGLSASATWYGWSLLEDHFSPLLLPLAPLAATRWGGYWLVGFQALMGGWAVWWAWKLTERPWLTVAYATAPAVVFPMLYGIHSNIIAIPFVLMAAWGFRHNSWLAVVGGVGAALCREDVALLMILLGLIHWGSAKGRVVALAGLACVVAWFLLPSENGVGGLLYGWMADPSQVWRVIWAEGLLVFALGAMLLPWAFFNLDGRYVALAFIASLPWFLTDSLTASSLGSHYWALPVSLMVAAVRPGPGKPLLVATAALVGIIGGPFVTGALGPGGVTVPHPVNEIGRRDNIAAAHEAVGRLPDVPLAVPLALLPHTGHLSEVYALPQPFEPIAIDHGSRRFRIVDPIDATPLYTIGEPPVEGYERVDEFLWRLGGAD